MWVNNVTQVFRFLVCYVCLVLWMPMKKHILAIVYVVVAIMLIMLFGVQQLERSCSVQRNWECKRQICNLHSTRSKSSRALTSIDLYNWHKWQLEYHATHFLLCNKYNTDLNTAKESNCENKVHTLKTLLYGSVMIATVINTNVP